MLAGVASGQPFPESPQIATIRETIRTYLDQLPRVTCIERTRQTVRIVHAQSTETREDSCDTHQYKLYAVQSVGILGGRAYEQPAERARLVAPDWRERLKEASLGAATGFLAALVDPKADADFRWVRMGKVNGRAVSVYAFHAAMPEGYVLADAIGSVRVPFKGFLYADAATGALVRVELQCVDIPGESEYIGAEVAVDFSTFDVAGGRIELPAHSQVQFQMKRGAAINEADYSAYRLANFYTDSGIRFADIP
jgi:hypothetical protein